MLFCQTYNKTVGNSIISMATDLKLYLTYNLRGAWHSSQITSEILTEMHTMEKSDFLNSTMHS